MPEISSSLSQFSPTSFMYIVYCMTKNYIILVYKIYLLKQMETQVSIYRYLRNVHFLLRSFKVIKGNWNYFQDIRYGPGLRPTLVYLCL